MELLPFSKPLICWKKHLSAVAADGVQKGKRLIEIVLNVVTWSLFDLGEPFERRIQWRESLYGAFFTLVRVAPRRSLSKHSLSRSFAECPRQEFAPQNLNAGVLYKNGRIGCPYYARALYNCRESKNVREIQRRNLNTKFVHTLKHVKRKCLQDN